MKKNIFYGAVLILALVIGYIALTNSYEDAVKDCSENHSVDYCKTVMAR